jgi:MFS family permease
MRNKYFWILSLGSWLGFLENAFYNILSWLYNYQGACTAGQYALISAINGNASLYPNIISPILVRKIGKRNILILSNLLNIAFIALMRPVVVRAGSPNIIWLMLVCVFVNGLTTGVGNNIGPALNADVRDYQHYVTGERIDGMFSAVGLIGSVIGMATGVVLPAIQERAGLNRAVALSLGYDGTNVYDVLHNREYFVQICGILVIASVIGAVMNVLPYFFYDLTETKQRAMIAVLKIRTFFEDHPEMTSDGQPEALALIGEAMAFAGKTPYVITKKERKNKKKQFLAENEKIEIASFILKELHRFESGEGRAEIEDARKTAAAGLSIEEFDLSVFDRLYTAADETELAIDACHKSLLKAKNEKDSAAQREIRNQLTALRVQKAGIERELKQATKDNAIYNQAAKPYVQAQRLLLLERGYQLYAEGGVLV